MQRLAKSFVRAVRGIAYALRHEQSFRIQTVAAAVVIVFMYTVGLRGWEQIIILLLIMVVLILELLNTIFERILDIVKPQLATYVREIKDLMSGVVLIASVFAAVIGLFIFLPHVLAP